MMKPGREEENRKSKTLYKARNSVNNFFDD